ncbi:hypothetical protein AB0F91_24465 [Amycolatopsis sp. NPDC023774]|uniref:hypothetical protein n=1 Tax=Amycolatopsis sp. NPDC023774 TaxID=3155015 RepID=UPI0033CF4654
MDIDEGARADIADGMSLWRRRTRLARFFARLDFVGNFRWVVAPWSNPCERIAVAGTVVEVTGNLGNSVSFDLLDPNSSQPGRRSSRKLPPTPAKGNHDTRQNGRRAST